MQAIEGYTTDNRLGLHLFSVPPLTAPTRSTPVLVGLWLVRSHSSFLFDTGQPLLVDFDFCFATIRSPDAVGGL